MNKTKLLHFQFFLFTNNCIPKFIHTIIDKCICDNSDGKTIYRYKRVWNFIESVVVRVGSIITNTILKLVGYDTELSASISPAFTGRHVFVKISVVSWIYLRISNFCAAKVQNIWETFSIIDWPSYNVREGGPGGVAGLDVVVRRRRLVSSPGLDELAVSCQ